MSAPVDLDALDVDLVLLDQAIDTTTPADRLLRHMLTAIAEFERDLIQDRVLAVLRRVRAEGDISGGRESTAWTAPRRGPFGPRALVAGAGEGARRSRDGSGADDRKPVENADWRRYADSDQSP